MNRNTTCTIQGFPYPIPDRLGSTVAHAHKHCPASGGSTDHKDRLYLTLRDKSTVLYFCHHCGAKGKARGWYNPPVENGPQPPKEALKQPSIPGDAGPQLDVRAIDWLYSYGIDQQLARKYGMLWSIHGNSLVIPIQELSTGQRIGHILRLFSTSANTRYLSKLQKEHGLAGLKRGLTSCFIVEDWISCIRLAELGYTAVCLLGTGLSKQGYWELMNLQAELFVVWLDNDSRLVRGKAREIQATLLSLGKQAVLATGKEEPKRLTTEQLSASCRQLQ